MADEQTLTKRKFSPEMLDPLTLLPTDHDPLIPRRVTAVDPGNINWIGAVTKKLWRKPTSTSSHDQSRTFAIAAATTVASVARAGATEQVRTLY